MRRSWCVLVLALAIVGTVPSHTRADVRWGPDVTPPVIASVEATPRVVWPPDGRMETVAVTVSVRDDRDPSPRCAIGEVTISGAVIAADSDVRVTAPLSVMLRAVRSGAAAERRYTIGVRCADSSNNRTAASVVVTVPHDRSNQ